MGLVTAFGLVAGLMKLLVIGWTAFLVMMAGAEMGRQAETHVVGTVARRLRRLAWAYGLSSGAMITSDANQELRARSSIAAASRPKA